MPDESPVTFHQGDAPQIVQASERARETFRYFWNQVSLDFNRIVPALELAFLKVPFSDDYSNPDAQVEEMWVEQVNFDGIDINGVLLNSPNWLKSVKQGDEVHSTLSQLSDWLCVLEGQVYGAHTVQLLRSRMADEERTQHDQAWGLNFPSPSTVLTPEHNQKFEDVIATLLSEQIVKDPVTVEARFDHGRTILHLEALYGRAPSVRVLLDHGASTTARCDRGWTPLDYARSLQWTHVVTLLENE